MKKLVFISFVLLSFTSLFAQSRPRVEDTLQKTNKRPPPQKTIETQPKSEKAPDDTRLNSEIVQTSENSDGVMNTSDEEVLRIDTNLVTVPVRISDRNNRFIGGLQKEDFSIFEDGKEQTIAYFSDAEEPFTVALILDMSYSSTFKISEIQSAALAFITQLHPDDKVMIVSFDEEVHVLCEPTNDRQTLQRAIKTTQIASGTSLYEAVDLVINQRLRKIKGRKAVVLFTDGVDTTSRRVFAQDNLRDAIENDSLIYPIEYDTYSDVQRIKNNPTSGTPPTGIPQKSPIPGTSNPFPFPLPGTGTTLPSPLPRTGGNQSPLPFPMPTLPSSQGTSAEDYRKAREYLQELADNTSGRVYKASTTANLADAFSKIASELRQIYSLGFYPAEEKAGKRRQLKVRINKEGAVVRARESYVVGEKKNKK